MCVAMEGWINAPGRGFFILHRRYFKLFGDDKFFDAFEKTKGGMPLLSSIQPLKEKSKR